jgi:ABC-2 type transport system permease protein
MVIMGKNEKNIKKQNLFQLLIVIAVIAAANIAGSVWYTRFDLTSEKRYTLSKSTVEILKNLDDIVFFKVFLDGEFPAGFKRLKRETKELLDEFRAYTDNVQYEFINPSESDDPKERNDTYKLLMEQGLQPTNLKVKTKNGIEQKVIFPGAIVSYRQKELPVELLDAQINVPPEAVLNHSIENLEFKLVNAIRRITQKKKPQIAFIEGHGELSEKDVWDITQTLKQDYAVNRIRLDGNINALMSRFLTDSLKNDYEIKPKFRAIIIAKPDSAFSDKDKFIIDQYIMYGGKVLWLIDPVFVSMDSIQNSESTVAIDAGLRLQDLIFTYGARLNKDLIMDLNALPIPLKTGMIGNQPQIEFFTWYYFPVITPVSQHPIVRNLNAIKMQFVSSIDTNRVKDVKKTILLKSSPYSRTVNVPAIVSLSILRKEPNEKLYHGPPRAVAVLLEGAFKSFFDGRIPPSLMMAKEIGFKNQSEKNQMIIVSDGDVIRNQFKIPGGYPLPLGYDQYTRETFGNKEFLLNALNYLTGGEELISIRSKQIKLRLLDMTRVNKYKVWIQLVNVAAPVLLIIILGVILVWVRKKKYAKRA